MDASIQGFISNQISQKHTRVTQVGGGSINDTYRIEFAAGNFFCKINSAKKFPGLFQKEQNGLMFIKETKTLKVPEVVWCGEFEHKQILILEWIEEGLRTNQFWKKFGEQLAGLHHTSSDGGRRTTYGFIEDNYMGALAQTNHPCDEWVEFFITKRLQPQIQLACDKRLMTSNDVDAFGQLFKKLETIFPKEKPSALHGDLWSGNYLCAQDSVPVLIDPAVYYGHRSIDLGMTKLFGGFDQAFYEAYHYHFTLPQNFDEQVAVCNLYPLLIHLNLFGSGYLSSIKSILKRFAE